MCLFAPLACSVFVAVSEVFLVLFCSSMSVHVEASLWCSQLIVKLWYACFSVIVIIDTLLPLLLNGLLLLLLLVQKLLFVVYVFACG